MRAATEAVVPVALTRFAATTMYVLTGTAVMVIVNPVGVRKETLL